MNIDELVKEIEKHDKAYWSGNPIISDREYDVLIQKLREIDPNHHLVNKIHTPATEGSKKVIHKNPMRSLAKVYSIADLIAWCSKVSRSDNEGFTIEYKFDGWSASLDDGVLATRGDGEVGEDISSKLPIINILALGQNGDPIPRSQIKNLRGEIVIVKSKYDNIKDIYDFKHPRNALTCFLGRDDLDTSQGPVLTLIGFNTLSFPIMMKDISALKDDPRPFERIIATAEMSEYPTDGLVIKLEDQEYAKSLGATSHHAKGEIAFKFANPTGESKLLGIEWSVGKHDITPIGKVEPVVISGVTIQNINLHNFGYVMDNDIHIGDTIVVERAGDVIPDVQSVIPGSERVVINLVICPSCGSDVMYDYPVLKCINPICSGKLLRRFMDSVVRIGIERLGLPTLEKLINQKGVKDLVDLFNLTELEIKDLPGFGEKSANNLYNEIQKIVNNPVEDWRILSCLNLNGIGTSLSKILLSEFSLDELRDMTVNDFLGIEGIGPERAVMLVNGLVENSEYIDNLRTKLPVISSNKKEQSSEGSVASKIKICFTGKFPKPKSYYYKLLPSEYEVTERMNKETNVLVVADPSKESNKTKAAKKKGISIIGIYDLFDEDLLNQEA